MDILVIEVPTGDKGRAAGATPAPAGVALREVARLLLVGARTRGAQSLGGAALSNDHAGSSLRHPNSLRVQRPLDERGSGLEFSLATYFNMSMLGAWFPGCT